MAFDATAWATQKTRLASAKSSAADALSSIHAAVTGFQSSTFTKRSSAGHCLHDGYFHIGCGWEPGVSFVPGHFRTNDFVTIERAIEPLSLPNICFHEMESFDSKIWRGPGLDTLQQPSGGGDDLTTNAIYFSDNGSAPWTSETSPPSGPRECAMLLNHDGYLYSGLGVRYTGVSSPVYVLPRDICRKAPGGSWSVRNSDLGISRRSFGYVSYQGAIWIIAGADDTNFPTRVDSAKIYKSTDGLLSITDMGDCPFTGYGMRCANWKGGVVMVGGASGLGSGFALSDQVWFSDDPDLAPTSWTQLASLPEAAQHIALGVLTISGVETLAAIGGYVRRSGVDSASGRIYTLDSLTGSWQARTESGFWVD